MARLTFFRKFGLEYCDLPTMMWNVSFLLKLQGLNIDDKVSSIPLIFFLVTVACACCYYYVYLFSMVWFVFLKSTVLTDVLTIILLSLCITSEIGPVKLFHTMLHAKQVRKIASTSLACDALVVPGSRFHRNLRKTLRIVKKRAIVFWLVMMGNGVIYSVKLLHRSGKLLMIDTFKYYGFEVYESPNYDIALTINIIAVMFVCYSVANVTSFIIINAGYVEAQMLSWSEELQHLWNDAEYQTTTDNMLTYHQHLKLVTLDEIGNDDANLKNRDQQTREAAINKLVQPRLIEVIEGHCRNLNLLRQIDNVFRGAFAMEFIILIVALIAELLGGLENTYIELPFSFLPVVIDCLTGQRLEDASALFQRAVYQCKWENFNQRNKKLVLLMLQSSQNTMRLSAGGMAVLNFSCLMSFIKTVYSAYTALRSYTTTS